MTPQKTKLPPKKFTTATCRSQTAPSAPGGQFGTVHFFAAFADTLAPRSFAKRCAVRFRAAASDAFLARAARSSDVMFWAAVLPPSLPNLREISAIAARTSAGIFTLMTQSYT